MDADGQGALSFGCDGLKVSLFSFELDSGGFRHVAAIGTLACKLVEKSKGQRRCGDNVYCQGC